MVTLKAQLVEKQEVQSENDRLKLQVDSMKAQSQLEQRKTGEERWDTLSDICLLPLALLGIGTFPWVGSWDRNSLLLF